MANKRARGRVREVSEFRLKARALARDVWFAGLGVVSRTQVEPAQRILALIDKGSALRARGLKVLERGVRRALARPELKAFARRARAWRREAGGRVDRFETVLQAPMQRVLAGLGLPTRREIETLARHVDALARSVDAMRGAPARSRRGRAAA